MDVRTAALNLVRAKNEAEQNYWRAWLGHLLDGWPKPREDAANGR